MNRGLPVRALRAVSSVHAALVLIQAAFAGRFLAGDAAGLRLHERNAELILVVALVQLVVALLAWRPGRGPGWPAGASLALLVAEVTQMGFGYEGRLAVHVPLGVVIFGLAVTLALASWRRPRSASQAAAVPER
jgi:hypothetical protein